MRSGLAVPGDGAAGTSAASEEVGAVLWAGLDVVLVRLADLDLLKALGAGVLGAVMPLVVTVVGAEGRDWAESTVSGLDERT